MPAQSERFTITGSKGLVSMALAAVLGVGGTVGVQRIVAAEAEASSPARGLTRAEVVEVTSQAEARANAYAKSEADRAKEDCRRELAQAQNNLAATLTRIETKLLKLDTLAEDVAALKGRGRR